MFYKFWRSVIVALAYALFGVQVRGRDRVPKGVFILAPSHRSTLDIPFSAAITSRRMRFMAKREIFHGKFWTWVFNELGAVPVDRDGGDRAALRVTEAALLEGEPVVIFPEGTRREGAELGALFSGAAYLALKQGVPIVPVGVGGSDRVLVRHRGWSWFSRVCVVVGEPIVLPRTTGTIKRSVITATNEELRARLQASYDEAVRWAAARNGDAGGALGSGGEPGEGV
jgi:1-acyl-sn-glycerol-3-phosphate acyltransferase